MPQKVSNWDSEFLLQIARLSNIFLLVGSVFILLFPLNSKAIIWSDFRSLRCKRSPCGVGLARVESESWSKSGHSEDKRSELGLGDRTVLQVRTGCNACSRTCHHYWCQVATSLGLLLTPLPSGIPITLLCGPSSVWFSRPSHTLALILGTNIRRLWKRQWKLDLCE